MSIDVEALTKRILDEMPAIAPEEAFTREFRRRLTVAVIEECALETIVSQRGDGRAQARNDTARACANYIRALKPWEEG